MPFYLLIFVCLLVNYAQCEQRVGKDPKFDSKVDCVSIPLIQKSPTGYTLIIPTKTTSKNLKNFIIHYDKDFKQLARQKMDGKIKAATTNCWVADDKHDISRFQGVAGPLNFDGGYLMLVHEEYNAEKHYDFHRFIYLDTSFHVTKTTNLFTFKHKGSEQCLSMVTDHSDKKLILSINVEESNAELCFIDLDTVRSLLKPLP